MIAGRPGPNFDAIFRGGSTHSPARDFPRAGCLLCAAGNRAVRRWEFTPSPAWRVVSLLVRPRGISALTVCTRLDGLRASTCSGAA